MVTGVFGGLGEYYEIDPTLLRLVGLLVIIFTGILPGTIVYLLAAAIIPPGPGKESTAQKAAKDLTGLS